MSLNWCKKIFFIKMTEPHCSIDKVRDALSICAFWSFLVSVVVRLLKAVYYKNKKNNFLDNVFLCEFS